VAAGGGAKDAIGVCATEMADPQLALLIARLMDSSQRPSASAAPPVCGPLLTQVVSSDMQPGASPYLTVICRIATVLSHPDVVCQPADGIEFCIVSRMARQLLVCTFVWWFTSALALESKSLRNDACNFLHHGQSRACNHSTGCLLNAPMIGAAAPTCS
jgi:hypothetical protein